MVVGLHYLDTAGSTLDGTSLCKPCERRVYPPLVFDGWATSRFTGKRVKTYRVRPGWKPPRPSGAEKECHCGRLFTPLRASAKHCSDVCRATARRRALAEARKAE
jgi:hypothetical protein